MLTWILIYMNIFNKKYIFISKLIQKMHSQMIESLDQQQRKKAKKRMLNQTKKLNTQIRQLQKQINDIIAIDDLQNAQKNKTNNGDIAKHRQEIAIQQKYIRKLKNKIQVLKSTNSKDNAFFITKQEDELKIMKKQRQNLQAQKEIMEKYKDDKHKMLSKNKPFQDHKKQLQSNLAQTRKQNSKMQSQIIQLQREIRKFHSYIILNKIVNGNPKLKKTNTQIEQQLKHQIRSVDWEVKQQQAKCKQVEEKYKNQIQILDKQLFKLRADHSKTFQKLGKVQVQCRTWEIRKNGQRDLDQIVQFRDRLSKIQISPAKVVERKTNSPKPNQMNKSLLLKKNRQQQSETIIDKINSISKNSKSDKKRYDVDENVKKQSVDKSKFTQSQQLPASLKKILNSKQKRRKQLKSQNKTVREGTNILESQVNEYPIGIQKQHKIYQKNQSNIIKDNLNENMDKNQTKNNKVINNSNNTLNNNYNQNNSKVKNKQKTQQNNIWNQPYNQKNKKSIQQAGNKNIQQKQMKKINLVQKNENQKKEGINISINKNKRQETKQTLIELQSASQLDNKVGVGYEQKHEQGMKGKIRLLLRSVGVGTD